MSLSGCGNIALIPIERMAVSLLQFLLVFSTIFTRKYRSHSKFIIPGIFPGLKMYHIPPILDLQPQRLVSAQTPPILP